MQLVFKVFFSEFPGSYFITGNQDKVHDVQEILGLLIQNWDLVLDLPEIQEIDSTKIIENKLDLAWAKVQKPLSVDDMELHLGVWTVFQGAD